MKKLFLLFFVSITIPSFTQETKLMNLCHLGNDRIDLYLRYEESKYILFAAIVKDEGFYIDKGADFSIMTDSDTVHLTGLTEGQSKQFSSAQSMPIGTLLYRFTQNYYLIPEQIKILKASLIKRVSIELSGSKLTMEVTSLREDVIIQLFEKLEKKIK